MIDVEVTFLSFIKFETGLDVVKVALVENSTIQDLIETLRSSYGEELSRFLIARDNAKLISIAMMNNQICDLTTNLKHEDKVVFMPTAAGG